MIEKIVLDYLSSIEFKELVISDNDFLIITGDNTLEMPVGAVLDVPCYAERPETDPERTYVVIEKIGSTEVNHITSATVAIQSYGLTLYEAALLNEEVKSAMKNIVQLPEVSACDLNSDYNYTYTAMKAYRYQAVFAITYYEEEN